MQTQEIFNKIKKSIIPHVEGLGYELVDFVLFKASGKLVLRFLVDRPSGGISLKECSSLNEQIGVFLDTGNILETGYVLEVSSPGVGRELKTKKDFLRVYGKKVRVFLKEPLNQRFEKLGVVDSVQNGLLFLNSDSSIEKIPINKINKAKQVIE